MLDMKPVHQAHGINGWFACSLGAVAAVIVQASAVEPSRAQTLADPTPHPHTTTTTTTTLQPQSNQRKPCPAFGPGFVQVPGTDTCVRVGGGMQMQGGAH
jgi:hypothetical protein